MGLIRLWGIAVFVAAVLIFISTLDWIVERAIEEIGTDVNGASVELDSADVSFWPATIQLTNVQVADPHKPSNNRHKIFYIK